MKDTRFSKKLTFFLAVSFGALFLIALLQTSFLPPLGLLGAVPDLTLIFACGIAFYLGPVDGAVFGLIGGILVDALGGAGAMLSPVLYTVTAFLLGTLARLFLDGRFVYWCIYSVVFCLAKALYSATRILLSGNGRQFGDALLASVLPEWIGTLALSLALAFPVKWLAGVLRGRMNLKKGKGGLGDL